MVGDNLLNNFSSRQISEKTGLSKKHLEAHIKNMMEKLKAEDMSELIKLLKGLKQ
ncbi:MAG: hypothetical protein H0V14_01620 [Chitinophagaceae bacterium]|nr:hypothetical protein [Chitinophagaceae bacterium]